jgi:fatty-acyl-CoA synthase
LREDALVAARRLIAMGVKPEDRVALVAETGAEFAALFFGAVYAGAWPVPLPLPTSFGGRESYVEQLRVQLASCGPVMLLYPPELAEMGAEAARQAGTRGQDWASFSHQPASDSPLPQAQPDQIALPAILQRLDALPARRGDHPRGAAQQPGRARAWHGDRGRGPLHLLAAVVP